MAEDKRGGKITILLLIRMINRARMFQVTFFYHILGSVISCLNRYRISRESNNTEPKMTQESYETQKNHPTISRICFAVSRMTATCPWSRAISSIASRICTESSRKLRISAGYRSIPYSSMRDPLIWW
jgi:hypothetical protein